MLIASDSLHPDLVLATKMLADDRMEPGDMILVVRRTPGEDIDIAILVHQGKTARINSKGGRDAV